MSHGKTVLVLTGALLALALGVSCSRKGSADSKDGDGKKFNPSSAAVEYQLLQAQLRLSGTDKPYLVIDFDRKQIRVELKGTLVWGYPLDISPDDAAEVGDFVTRFRSNAEMVRPITQAHLFSGASKTPDSVLNIVSEVTKLRPELLQRELPERFDLLWGEYVILDVRTDQKGVQTDKLKNTIFEIRHAIQTPLGKSKITIKMPADRALTLFRVAQPGLPTLVIPPKA
jgi:hypothetical protein